MDNKVKAERNQRIYEAREAGAKLVDLAREHGICANRVRQIHLKIEWRMRRQRYPYPDIAIAATEGG